MSEIGKLIIDTDESLFKDWVGEIDITAEYNEYINKTINLNEFNNKYYNKLIENKQLFEDFNIITNIFNELKNVVDYNQAIHFYEQLYDIYDKNSVLLKINNISNE